MLPQNNAEIVAAILEQEGGYTNNPNDPGGATNFGITVKSLSEWAGHQMTAAEVVRLTKDQAAIVYQGLYIDKPGFGKINDVGLRSLIVDSGVNNGRGRTTQWLQAAVGVKVDGVCGPATISRVNMMWTRGTFYRVCASRVECYGQLVAQKHALVVFVDGWLKRVSWFIREGVLTSDVGVG